MKCPRKLIILSNDQVAELVRLLEKAEIKCFRTPEGAGGPTEAPDALRPEANSTLWVEDADLPRAHPIAQSFVEEVQRRARRDKCQACGYDLRVHGGTGRCPECGAAFDIPQRLETRTCANCGEDGPGDFEVCWSCGHGYDDAS
jgi:hypothetical protein